MNSTQRLLAQQPGWLSGATLITAERVRQIEDEGYTLDHDLAYFSGQLIDAAIAYAYHASGLHQTDAEVSWPWDLALFKPGSPVEDLVKAGALIAAEIDRQLKLRIR